MKKKFINFRKSQIFSTDLIIALLVFTALLVFVAGVWRYSIEKSASENFENEMHARIVAEQLVSTAGSPANWSYSSVVNSTYVNSIGLAAGCRVNCLLVSPNAAAIEGRSVIDLQKLSKFNQSYSGASQLLGMAPFSFKADLFVFNGSEYVLNFSAFANQSYEGSTDVYII